MRKKERDEKIARGEEVGREEPDPTAEREVSVVELLKLLVYTLLFIMLAGKFIAGDFFWGYEGKWTNLKTYWPVSLILTIYALTLFAVYASTACVDLLLPCSRTSASFLKATLQSLTAVMLRSLYI